MNNRYESFTLLMNKINKSIRKIKNIEMEEYKLKGVHVRFQYENGAGSTISDVLKTRVLEDQKISLCIVDSDFKHGKTTKYPNSPGRGETANKLLRTERELRKQEGITPFEVYCLDVHEVENLIPIISFKLIVEK